MAEYIDREVAIESFRKNLDGGYVLTNDAQTTYILRSLPAADVRTVVRAKWDVKTVAFFFKCTNCGCCVCRRYDVFLDRGELNFCPNCGADMR